MVPRKVEETKVNKVGDSSSDEESSAREEDEDDDEKINFLYQQI